ncbi:MAG: pyridoxamine 5'-phosphate oxidase, partial [Methanosarcinales archaeon]|nr:pyridoxamine 5'-phosphate oxidase [Methanosarcinales archaeon]
MVKMPSEVIELIEKQKIIPIATASSNGVPNVAYIGLLKILDNETILIVDNFFNKTKINLENNPIASLAVYDITTREAY